MHARITTVTGASDIDAGLALLRDETLPQLHQQHGFGGLSAAGDRAAGWVMVLSLWDSEADLRASESTASKARDELAQIIGGDPSVERFEQTISEVGDSRPGPGAWLHIRHVQIDPARI